MGNCCAKYGAALPLHDSVRCTAFASSPGDWSGGPTEDLQEFLQSAYSAKKLIKSEQNIENGVSKRIQNDTKSVVIENQIPPWTPRCSSSRASLGGNKEFSRLFQLMKEPNISFPLSSKIDFNQFLVRNYLPNLFRREWRHEASICCFEQVIPFVHAQAIVPAVMFFCI